jgi:homoserine O-acetyltransferase
LTVNEAQTKVADILPPPDGRVGTVDIGSLQLENGAVLPSVSLAVQRWGELSPNRDNVVLVEHALTGDSHVTGPASDTQPSPGWWNGMVGPGEPVDTGEWSVIATNVLGG